MKRVHYSKLADHPEQGDFNTLRGKPFTGVAYDDEPDGRVTVEWTYRDGVLWGPRRIWAWSGRPQGSAYFVRGVLHGVCRGTYNSGPKEGVSVYQYGICVRRKRWGLDGQLKEDFTLREDSEEFKELREREAKYRELFAAEPIPPEFLILAPEDWDDPLV